MWCLGLCMLFLVRQLIFTKAHMQIRAICRSWSVLSKKLMSATSLLYIVVVNLRLSSLKCDLYLVFSLWQFCFEHLELF